MRRRVPLRRPYAALPLIAVLLLVSACTAGSPGSPTPGGTATPGGSAGSTAADPGDGPLQLAVITHGDADDPFWRTVARGAQDAAAEDGVDVTYQSDPDPARQAALVDAAVAAGVDGLVVSLADPDALADALRNASVAGIPLITVNAGQDRAEEFGALTHVGQSDLVAGQAAGQRLRTAGATTLLCVGPADNDAVTQRCAGVAQGFGGDESSVLTLRVDSDDPVAEQNAITAELATQSGIDGVITSSSALAAAAVRARADAGSRAVLATFEVDESVREEIRAGTIAFGVDQQEYLQGYLPVGFLALFLRHGVIAGAGQYVATGPLFVTADNVDTRARLSTGGHG